MTVIRATLTVIALLHTAPALAQPSANIPRTVAGQPDLDGVWATQFPTFFFQRVGPTKELVVDDAKALAIAREICEADQTDEVTDSGDALGVTYALPKVNGEWRTSMVTIPANGIAPLTPEAKEITADMRAVFNASPDGPEMRDCAERCLVGSGNPPFGMFPTQNYREFVQTRDNLVIYSEDQGETRIIGTGAKPRPATIVTFLGYSTH